MESQNILTTTLTQLKEQREVKNKQYVSIKWELKKLDKEIATIEKLIADANPEQAQPGQAV
jgi:predicted  nucleic acid-binding Zn-ribbon protein